MNCDNCGKFYSLVDVSASRTKELDFCDECFESLSDSEKTELTIKSRKKAFQSIVSSLGTVTRILGTLVTASSVLYLLATGYLALGREPKLALNTLISAIIALVLGPQIRSIGKHLRKAKDSNVSSDNVHLTDALSNAHTVFSTILTISIIGICVFAFFAVTTYARR